MNGPMKREDLGEQITAEPLDPGVTVWTWLTLTVDWFQKHYGKLAEAPTMAFLPGRFTDLSNQGDILGTTGSGNGRDIIFSKRILELSHPQFFITVLHELHEYRLLGGHHIHVSPFKEGRPMMDPVELGIERQARLDWKGFCRRYGLKHCHGSISAIPLPKV
jgi:hypothetical protein